MNGMACFNPISQPTKGSWRPAVCNKKDFH
jgi:hypothetical protein